MPNPILDREPHASLRDPAALWHEGTFHLFYTVVERAGEDFRLFVDASMSRDLRAWSSPRRLTRAGLNFSSHGNVIRLRDRWILCLQSYPTSAGKPYGSDASRLWLMESRDLHSWSEPRLLQPAGDGDNPFSTARYRGNGCTAEGASTTNKPSYCAPGLVTTGTIYQRRLEGTNLAFVDGHVKRYRTESAGQKGRIYNARTPFSLSESSPPFTTSDGAANS